MADLKVMTQPNSFTASFFSLNRSSINETLIKSIFIYTSAITVISGRLPAGNLLILH